MTVSNHFKIIRMHSKRIKTKSKQKKESQSKMRKLNSIKIADVKLELKNPVCPVKISAESLTNK